MGSVLKYDVCKLWVPSLMTRKNSYIYRSVARGLLSAAFVIISLSAVAQNRNAAQTKSETLAAETVPTNETLIGETLAFTDSLTLPARPPQNPRYPKVKLAYDVDFEMNFDNKEYQSTQMYKSNTIFGARLTPSLGLEVIQNEKIRHYLMGGIDIMKDFGRGSDKDPESGETSTRHQNTDLFQEITLYYRLDYQFEKTRMNLYAGIFPKRLSKAEWTEAFVSDSLKFYDNNYEGLLVTFDRPNSYYEVGCDWFGFKGKYERERFMIFTYGKSQLKPWLGIGWSAYLYHYANSEVATGVCDNILINPFVDFDLAPFVPLQRLAFTVGWLQGMQRERVNGHGFVMPGGGELTFEIRKWNVGLINRLYVGTNLQPFYNDLDSAGYKYGNEFYRGESFYRVFDNGNTSSIGVYDKIELYYEPHICDFLDLRVSLDEHFAAHGVNGFQQRVSLIFNLQRLLRR